MNRDRRFSVTAGTRARKLSTGALLVLAFLPSCAQSPEPLDLTPRIAIPDHWSTPQSPAPPPPAGADWWTSFRTPELTALIVEALGGSPNLRAAAERIRAADATARQAGAGALPQLNIGATGSRSQIQFSAPGGDLATLRRTLYGSSLSLNWEIDLWGRIRAGQRAALADLEEQAYLFDGARLSLAAQVARAYMTLLDNHKQLELASAEHTSADQIHQRVLARYQRGLGDALDVQLAAADDDRTHAEALTRRRWVDTSTRQLEILVGRYPAGTLTVGAEFPTLGEPIPMGLPSELLARRPDLAAAERRLAATLERRTVAQLDRLPRIALTASTGTTSEKLAKLLDRDFGVWSLLANLTAPILDGGARAAETGRREAVSRQALHDYTAAVLSAYGEVEQALRSEVALVAEVSSLASAATASRTSATLTEQRYFSGLSDVFALLEARRRLFAQERAEFSRRRDLLLNRVDLHVALGGGFTASPSSAEQDL